MNSQDSLRLQVYIAHCGVASRRAAEQIILDGRVSVNGKVVCELGTKVSGDDKVFVDGNQIFLEQTKQPFAAALKNLTATRL